MKKLIIVCEEKCRQYGDYLAQLISLEDDKEDETVGAKDGEVAAQVWLEKDYKANAAQLSSNQYILFIGQDKLIKEKSSHMNMGFAEFGMKYGWLGKQAVLSVEKVVEADKYENQQSDDSGYGTACNRAGSGAQGVCHRLFTVIDLVQLLPVTVHQNDGIVHRQCKLQYRRNAEAYVRNLSEKEIRSEIQYNGNTDCEKEQYRLKI